MGSTRPQRKRKQPVRYDSSEEEMGQEFTGIIENPVREEEMRGKSKKLARRVRQEGEIQPKPDNATKLMYRMLRRTVGTLTTKLNKLSEEVGSISSHVKEVELGSVMEKPQDGEKSHTLTVGSGSTIEMNQSRPSEVENREEKRDNGIPSSIIYNIKNINTEKPRFGNSEKEHPITFLEDLEAYLKREVRDGRELELIHECLTGEVRDWARIYRGRWEKVEDFKTDFLTNYWGEHTQSELRRTIVQGVWDKQEKQSMLNHFLQLVGKSKMLSYAIPEKQLVTDIIRHYPKHVQQTWMASGINDIIRTAEFLREMDSISKQKVHVYSQQENAKVQEKKWSGIKKTFPVWRRPTVGPGTTQRQHAVVNLLEGEGEATTVVGHGQALN